MTLRSPAISSVSNLQYCLPVERKRYAVIFLYQVGTSPTRQPGICGRAIMIEWQAQFLVNGARVPTIELVKAYTASQRLSPDLETLVGGFLRGYPGFSPHCPYALPPDTVKSWRMGSYSTNTIVAAVPTSFLPMISHNSKCSTISSSTHTISG